MHNLLVVRHLIYCYSKEIKGESNKELLRSVELELFTGNNFCGGDYFEIRKYLPVYWM